MKRFILFGGDNYYPAGGAKDLIDSFDTEEEVNNYISSEFDKATGLEQYDMCDWYNCIDTLTGGIRVIK
jgi:hypothetical protein